MNQLLLLPNLLSLSRVVLGPIVVWLLASNDATTLLLCLTLFVVAGVTDGLDGWLARRRGQVSPLGIALDPIADKIFAAFVVAGLLIYRDFPYWLAAVIVGRDLLILAGGLWLRRTCAVTVPSNLTGKYTFVAIILLLASYIIGFEFGIRLTRWLAVGLTVASLVSYGSIFARIYRGQSVRPFVDSALTKTVRLSVAAAFYVVFVWRLYTDWIAPLLID